MEKINIAELLKDSPEGTELWSPIFGTVRLKEVIQPKKDGGVAPYPIVVDTGLFTESFSEYGLYDTMHSDTECTLFPSKENRDWGTFHEAFKFKDGDILHIELMSYQEYIIIFKEISNGHLHKHASLVYQSLSSDKNALCHLIDVKDMRLATYKEKQKLLNAIKANGYSWNPETKTLEKLVEPMFKDGDIISDSLGTCIFKGEGEFEGTVNFYCGISNDYFRVKDDKRNPSGHYGCIVNYRLSTEEEKQKLFKAIKENGYSWNPETKTLEKLVEPRFKVGNRIRRKDGIKQPVTISSVSAEYYMVQLKEGEGALCVADQDLYELAPDKFDISTLKPFDKVLVRDKNSQEWVISFFSHCNGLERYKHSCINGAGYAQCVPYEENEHLLGTTNDCDEFYKNWE